MRLLSWAVRVLIFLLLLAFAAKNTQPATLQFYFGLAWETPLVVLLLAFFILGAFLGLAALFATVLKQRRELNVLRGKLAPHAGGMPAAPERATLRASVDG